LKKELQHVLAKYRTSNPASKVVFYVAAHPWICAFPMLYILLWMSMSEDMFFWIEVGIATPPRAAPI